MKGMNQMNRKLFVAVLLLSGFFLVANESAAQVEKAGIKGGLNVSNFYQDDVDDENSRFGFNAGVFSQFLITDGFGIQPEILYSTKGSTSTYNVAGFDGEYSLNLNYIDVPVLAVFRLGDDAEIHAGPYVSYLLSASTSTEGDFGTGQEDLDRDYFNSVDYGLAGGFALNFHPLTIGLRYNLGLAKIEGSEEAKNLFEDSKNSFGQVYAAISLK